MKPEHKSLLNIGGGDATPVRLFGELYCPARPAVNISWDCKVIEGRNQPWVALVVTIKKHFTQESIPAPRCSCNKVTTPRGNPPPDHSAKTDKATKKACHCKPDVSSLVSIQETRVEQDTGIDFPSRKKCIALLRSTC